MLLSECIVQLVNGIAATHLGQSVILTSFVVCSLCQRDRVPADLDRLVFLNLSSNVHLFLYPQVITQQTAFLKEQVMDDLIGLIDDIARNDNRL